MKRLIPLALSLMTLTLPASGIEGPRPSLRLSNDFKTPEALIQYYCARDAWGFFWAGMMELERATLTTWKAAHAAETFFISKSTRISKAKFEGESKATVEVRYELEGIGDGFGTRAPASEPVRKVTFQLQKIGDQWRITGPEPEKLPPVVDQAHAP